MKKMMMVLISLVCVIALAGSALACSTELIFTQRGFHGGQTLPVYYGPGHEYGRGANGWALVMYETGNGSVRVGYVDLSQFKYNVKTLRLSELCFDYTSATITKSCTLTDDPMLNNRDLAYLTEGTSVTCLASFNLHRNWTYIETWIDGRPIRAFVPADCVSTN